MTVIIFIIVLAVLIFVHELGHFLFAKWNGIRVDAFALGFGPKIIAIQKGETLYSLNLIPFGGYVKIFGENPDEESLYGNDKERSFVHKSRLSQAAVLVAGVLFNFIFAWLIYAVVFTYGVTATTDGFERYANNFHNDRIMITDVSADSPAQKAGLAAGDVIRGLSVQDQPAKEAGNYTIEDIQKTIDSSMGQAITLRYSRGSHPEIEEVTLKAVSGLVEGRFAIGVSMQKVADLKLPFYVAIYEGLHYTLVMIRDTFVGIYTFFSQILTGHANFSEVAGPVGIAGIVGNAAELGFTYLAMITAIISINLGVINLMPFPALDGGRLLFVAIESLIRRRISPKVSNIVNAVGFVLLMLLMIVITYKDIAKLIASAHEVYVLSPTQVQTAVNEQSFGLLNIIKDNLGQFSFWAVIGIVGVIFVFGISTWRFLEKRSAKFLAEIKPRAHDIARVTIGLAFLAAAYYDAVFGPEISLQGSFGGYYAIFARIVLAITGLMFLINFRVKTAAMVSFLVFAYVTYLKGWYMLTYVNYLGEIIVFLGLIDKAKSFAVLRILFGTALIYASFYAKILHNQLALLTVGEYHLDKILGFEPHFLVMGAALVEITIGIFFVLGLEIRFASIFLLFWLFLSLIYFGEVVWPHLILIGVPLALICHGYDQYSLEGYFFRKRKYKPVL